LIPHTLKSAANLNTTNNSQYKAATANTHTTNHEIHNLLLAIDDRPKLGEKQLNRWAIKCANDIYQTEEITIHNKHTGKRGLTAAAGTENTYVLSQRQTEEESVKGPTTVTKKAPAAGYITKSFSATTIKYKH